MTVTTKLAAFVAVSNQCSFGRLQYEVKMSQLLGDTICLWGNMYQQAVDDMYRYLMVNVTV